MHPTADQPQNATSPATAPVTPAVQLDFTAANPAQMLHRARAATRAVADAVSRGRPRYGAAAVGLYGYLATHTNAEGVALVSATDLAGELHRDPANVRTDLRALAAGGFVVPLERAEGVLVAATRHPRHRVGYLLPAMVAPPPSRPHVVR